MFGKYPNAWLAWSTVSGAAVLACVVAGGEERGAAGYFFRTSTNLCGSWALPSLKEVHSVST